MRHSEEAVRFGLERGWRFVDRGFSLNQLAARSRRVPRNWAEGSPVDHPYYYVDSEGPAAIVGHEYRGNLMRGRPMPIGGSGKHGGVKMEIREDLESFYNDGCVVVIFTPKSEEELREQVATRRRELEERGEAEEGSWYRCVVKPKLKRWTGVGTRVQLVRQLEQLEEYHRLIESPLFPVASDTTEVEDESEGR